MASNDYQLSMTLSLAVMAARGDSLSMALNISLTSRENVSMIYRISGSAVSTTRKLSLM